MFPFLLINPTILLTLSTSFGVLVHDLKIDQFTTSLFAAPAIVANYEGVVGALKLGDPHTHSERASISELGRTLNRQNPRVQPRNDNKKYRLENRVVRGHHPFDNYNLPVVG